MFLSGEYNTQKLGEGDLSKMLCSAFKTYHIVELNHSIVCRVNVEIYEQYQSSSGENGRNALGG